MKRLLTAVAASLALAPSIAAQEPPEIHPVSDVIANQGLTAAEGYLIMESAFSKKPETDFLLGGVRFLRGIEVMMQTRWENSDVSIGFIPGMRGDLPHNPNAEFDPAFLETTLTRGLEQMTRAQSTLKQASEDDFAVTVRITDIWFDVNKDGEMQKGEAAADLFDALQPVPPRPVRRRDENGELVRDENGYPIWDTPEVPEFDGLIRFDSADADWLAAYAHLVSGFGELVLAADPTPIIRRVTESRDQLRSYGSLFFDSTGWADEEWVEMAAATLLTLRGEPDAVRTRAAHQHFRALISYNRNFWDEVMEETDNEREWLPNPDQISAFGMPVDADLAESWQNVLGELSAVLEGEALVPYWRLPNLGERENGVGINLAKWLQDPGDMDLVLWIQGEAVLPYLERGRIVDTNVMNRFERLTRGNGLMFAAWFN